MSDNNVTTTAMPMVRSCPICGRYYNACPHNNRDLIEEIARLQSELTNSRELLAEALAQNAISRAVVKQEERERKQYELFYKLAESKREQAERENARLKAALERAEEEAVINWTDYVDLMAERDEARRWARHSTGLIW